MSDFNLYTTLDNSDGHIYKHLDDNSWGDWAGYVGNDGNVYDANNHVIGWVDSANGHVYNSAGVEVYDTNHGVVGAAAYLLCVYQGNVP